MIRREKRGLVIFVTLFLACAGMGTAVASGYLADSEGHVVKNAQGLCWRAGYWTPAQATTECDPDLVPKRPMAAPKPIAAPPPEPAARPAPRAAPAPPKAAAPAVRPIVFPLWFATNRNIATQTSFSVAFGNEWGGTTTYGKAFVIVPSDLLERLKVHDLRNKFFDAVERNVKYRNAIRLTEAHFIDDLRAEIQKEDRGRRSVLVYLHGFATTFEQAAQRSAALGYALGINTTAFFSWASAGNLLQYRRDLRTIEVSRSAIVAFLIRIAKATKAESVHVVAHSMGNHGLFQVAIDPILQDARRAGVRFGHIILAAPDVDARTFLNDVNYLHGIAKDITMYVSKDDKALQASKTLAAWPVAGLADPVIESPLVDTVDVSGTDLTFLGHAYVASDVRVLEDMLQLIRDSKSPARRTHMTKCGAHWKLLHDESAAVTACN